MPDKLKVPEVRQNILHQSGRNYGTSAGSQELNKIGDYLDSAKKNNCGTIMERYREDEQYRMRIHEQGYTQPDMEEYYRKALERKNYVATPEETCYDRDQHMVVTSRRQHRKEQRTSRTQTGGAVENGKLDQS